MAVVVGEDMVLVRTATLLTGGTQHFFVQASGGHHGSLWLTPEGIVEKAKQWLDLEETITGARDLSVVVELDNSF